MPAFTGRMTRAAEALNESWGSDEHGMFTVRDYRDKPFGSTFPDPGITWGDLEWLHGLSELPLILKGVIRPEDALRAREQRVLRILQGELAELMAITGAPRISDIDRSVLAPTRL